jgi:hypothetical protein
MEWLPAHSCSAAPELGWRVGAASGLWAMALVIALIASAPAYRLFVAQLSLLMAWGTGAYYAGHDLLPCYITTLALGAISVIAPLMLLMMFTAANWIGRASAR